MGRRRRTGWHSQTRSPPAVARMIDYLWLSANVSCLQSSGYLQKQGVTSGGNMLKAADFIEWGIAFMDKTWQKMTQPYSDSSWLQRVLRLSTFTYHGSCILATACSFATKQPFRESRQTSAPPANHGIVGHTLGAGWYTLLYGVSWNRGPPSHHPFIDGFSPINQPFLGYLHLRKPPYLVYLCGRPSLEVLPSDPGSNLGNDHPKKKDEGSNIFETCGNHHPKRSENGGYLQIARKFMGKLMTNHQIHHFCLPLFL